MMHDGPTSHSSSCSAVTDKSCVWSFPPPLRHRAYSCSRVRCAFCIAGVTVPRDNCRPAGPIRSPPCPHSAAGGKDPTLASVNMREFPPKTWRRSQVHHVTVVLYQKESRFLVFVHYSMLCLVRVTSGDTTPRTAQHTFSETGSG